MTLKSGACLQKSLPYKCRSLGREHVQELLKGKQRIRGRAGTRSRRFLFGANPTRLSGPASQTANSV